MGQTKNSRTRCLPEVKLSEARRRRDEARQRVANGVDPSEKRKAEKVEIKGLLTFEKVARDWHSSNRVWSESHSTTVLNSLVSHLFPLISN